MPQEAGGRSGVPMRNIFLGAVLPLLAASCTERAEVAVSDAWVRLPAVPGRPAAAYFVLRGGPVDTTLVAVRSDSARRAELHESMAGGMRALGSVSVSAGQEVRFAPGGKHVMLFDLDPRLAAGKTLTLRLSFADGGVLEARARAVGAAESAP